MTISSAATIPAPGAPQGGRVTPPRGPNGPRKVYDPLKEGEASIPQSGTGPSLSLDQSQKQGEERSGGAGRRPSRHSGAQRWMVRTRRIREAIRTGLTRGYSSGFRGSKEAVREANPGVAVRVLPLLALRGRRREGERVRWLQGGDGRAAGRGSAMGNLFGRKKQSRPGALAPPADAGRTDVPAPTDRTVFLPQLKQQRDKLRQYQKRVTQQLERERALARQLLRDGRKERAKLLLKKKRYREQLLDRTENQISSLEAMVQSIEFTQIEMKVMEGLQVGNECLNKMHQVMSIEEVERILDETQEAVEYQRQIDELLAGSFTQEDEDAILEELNAITQEQIELPEVPSEPLPETHPEKAPVKVRSRQADLVAAS
ncbi:charged multivesicular body protein 6 [Fukomys damarensis]|uniref:charged multivesicular body protein 6 n=1 Tax=Fukomys damarensis TaxID=885580 RepID=UPI00053F2BCB|nr:charged multivesicular body protein 6 [Fukomys damarensis]